MRSISCVFSVFLKNVAVDMNQRYFLLIKGIFMKLMKHLFSSLFVATTMLSSQVFAEEKVAEQAQPQAQVQQQTASQTTQQAVSDKLNINTASASEIQKALIGIGAKKAEAIVQYREKHGNFTALFIYKKRDSDISLFLYLKIKFTKTCKISNFFEINGGFLAKVF